MADAPRRKPRSSAKPKRKTETKRETEIPRDPLDVALDLAARHGWRRLRLSEVAAEAGLPLADLYRRYPSKRSLFAGVMARVDLAVLADGPGEGDNARERLFDVMMRRFDALKPHREAVRAFLREAPFSPGLGLMALGPTARSLRWMLAAAGLDASGPVGRLRGKGLALIYLKTMRVWLGDNTEDANETMASLDRELQKAERLVHSLPWRREESLAPSEA